MRQDEQTNESTTFGMYCNDRALALEDRAKAEVRDSSNWKGPTGLNH